MNEFVNKYFTRNKLHLVGFSLRASPDKQLSLLMVSFVFLVLVALTLNSWQESGALAPLPQVGQGEIQEVRIYPANPVLAAEREVSFPVLSAQAALALDLDSTTPLYEKNANETFLPASTTKIVTALVAMDYYRDFDVLTVGNGRVEGAKMGLVPGEKITANALLDGLLIASANDAAYALAYNYEGGEEAFVAAMNRKVTDLKLYNTHFENPTGFDGGRHFSTARDLIRVAIVAMENPKFAKVVGQKEKVVASTDGRIIHRLTSTNELLGKIEGVRGVKTGWTQQARENLVTYIVRDGRRVMIAILGSQNRFSETEELISWIFANYHWQEVKYPAGE